MHEVLVNRLGGLSLLRKSVVRLTDRPDMTLDVYRGRKTTIQQQQQRRVFFHCHMLDESICHFRDVGTILSPLFSLYPRHLCRGVYSFRLDVCPFVRSYVRSFVRVFVRSLLSVTFVEFTSKFLVKVSLSEYISITTHQKAFIFETWLHERVSFYTMSFCPRVDAPGWG